MDEEFGNVDLSLDDENSSEAPGEESEDLLENVDDVEPAPEEGATDVEGSSEAEGSSEEEEQEEQEEQEQEPEQQQDVKPGSRAQKRIQKLANENAELKQLFQQQAEQFRQQTAYLQQQLQMQAQQAQAYQQYLAQQAEFQQRQEWQEQQRRLQEEEDRLSPTEKLVRDWQRQASEQARQALIPEIQALKQELEQERALRTQAMQVIKQKQQMQQMWANATGAVQEHLLAGIDPKLATPNISDTAAELVATYATAFGVPEAEAVKQMKAFGEWYHKAQMAKVAKAGGSKIKQGKTMPKTSRGATSSKGNAWPSPEQLRAKYGPNATYLDLDD